MKIHKELPKTEELIKVLLSYGHSINMSLVDYHENVYGRSVKARYYSTDGLIENNKIIGIYIDNDIDTIFVQIDDDIIDYVTFKEEVFIDG